MALALGKDVAEVRAYDVLTLQEWYAYFLREPFGMDWFFQSQQTSVIANCLGRGKNSPAYKREQFMPFDVPQTAEEMERELLKAL